MKRVDIVIEGVHHTVQNRLTIGKRLKVNINDGHGLGINQNPAVIEEDGPRHVQDIRNEVIPGVFQRIVMKADLSAGLYHELGPSDQNILAIVQNRDQVHIAGLGAIRPPENIENDHLAADQVHLT